jgi:tight adherence protein C
MGFITLFSFFMSIVILILLFIGFVYIYLYVVKKESLLKSNGFTGKKVKKKTSFRDKVLNPLVKWGKQAGPIGIKYPFFADKEKHEVYLRQAGNPLGFQLQDFYGF